ncbi:MULTISPECIES: Rne/Rng family ribonuclease [Pseudothermotoga]|uniref:Rne/Rng family ribonuclease n=1 Tax=Pseudothermotoga TaxID=1643951 RepID=UPI0004178B1E|nr:MULTISPECIES: Rne/Rng family ribonuclease [Pseudothermotoga]MDI6863540.1 Rne/Rng family ribonuclease [Pseudothermotoga sp.]
MPTALIINVHENFVSGAILEDGELQEVFDEENETIAGNLYVGVIQKIIPALNAAFVDIGEGKNGFLRISDVGKSYVQQVLSGKQPAEGSKLLVQVKHDAVGQKGPQLTCKLSLPGRYVVYFPMSRVRGVSKKIVEQRERERLRSLFSKLEKNEGLVIRTASEGMPMEIIEEELQSLRQEWQQILSSFKRSRRVKLLRREPTAIDYVLRERLNKNVDEVYVNEEKAYELVKQEVKKISKSIVVHFVEGDLFERFSIYQQLNLLQRRTIDLPSGGYLALDTTEAMTVFDVNSASFTGGKNHAELAFRINMEAAKEIARQLRLRNIGGIVVVDFIGMPNKEYYDRLFKKIRESFEKDPAHVELLGFTRLGLFEMTRKRRTPSSEQLLFSPCPICKGSGRVLSATIVLKRLSNALKEIDLSQYGSVKINLHQRFSGYMEKIKALVPAHREKVKVSFTHPDPNEFEITLSKKT